MCSVSESDPLKSQRFSPNSQLCNLGHLISFSEPCFVVCRKHSWFNITELKWMLHELLLMKHKVSARPSKVCSIMRTLSFYNEGIWIPDTLSGPYLFLTFLRNGFCAWIISLNSFWSFMLVYKRLLCTNFVSCSFTKFIQDLY